MTLRRLTLTLMSVATVQEHKGASLPPSLIDMDVYTHSPPLNYCVKHDELHDDTSPADVSTCVGSLTDVLFIPELRAGETPDASLHRVCVCAAGRRGASRAVTGPAVAQRENNACGNSSFHLPAGPASSPACQL